MGSCAPADRDQQDFHPTRRMSGVIGAAAQPAPPGAQRGFLVSRRLAVSAVLAGLVAAPVVPAVFAADAPPAYALPTTGCFTYTDPKGDATYEVLASDDLDITGLALQSTGTALQGFAKVPALSPDGPGEPFDGHRFTLRFAFNSHVFSASGSDYGLGTGPVRDGLAETGQAAHTTQLGVDTPAIDPTDPNFITAKGFVESGLKVTFDYKNGWVIWDLPIADIEKYGKAKFTGALTAIGAAAQTDEYAVGTAWDVAPDQDEDFNDTGTWTVGDNKCFSGGASTAKTVLSYVGDTHMQYGDTAKVAAKVVGSNGKPVAGAPVTFAIGKLQTTAKANAKGLAATTLSPKVSAGRYSLVTSFADGDNKSSIKTPFVVTPERTVLVLTTAAKRITASLADDDKQPLAGQRVFWTVNGKSAGSAKTDKRGLATFSRAHKGDRVAATFKTVKGKYSGSSAKTVV